MKATKGEVKKVNKPGHPWHGRAVVAVGPAAYRIGWVDTELPEEQHLPHGKRMTCLFDPSELIDHPED